MPKVKKYILTGVILGSIAAVAGGLIALTNFITEQKILQNEENKLNEGIKEIFGNNIKVKRAKDATLVKRYTYIVQFFEVSSNKNEFLGYAFKSEGSNMYGKISLISGFDSLTKGFKGLSLIKNEQTYASTLVENYIEPLNSNDRELEDVSCGATYGAKLVRDMVNEASALANKLWK